MARTPRSKPLLQDSEAPIRSKPRRRRDPAQPNLLLDPMPLRVEPCLALLKPKPPRGPDWAFEIKWDGYRVHIHIEPNRIRILTKGGHDWTKCFPAIEEAARKLGVASAILDGEAIVCDEQGRSDFGLLQQSLGGRGGKRASRQAICMAFDLLYLDGRDLRQMELRARRHLLEELVTDREGGIRLSEEFDADGDQLMELAHEHGLEGIVAKHRDRPYRSGRTGDWLKIKCIQSDAFFIVGYEPSMTGFRRLFLAARKGDDLVYAGSVGTGFSERHMRQLRTMMDTIIWKRKQPPVVYGGKRKAVWLQPTLIAEIEYRAWTTDGKLRHPSYKGLRELQDDATVYDLDSGD